MDFHLPPPSPEQWTQAVLGVTGATVVYGGLHLASRCKRWLNRRALSKLQAILEPDAAPTKTPEPNRDPVAAGLLDLLARDEEWGLEPHADKNNFTYHVTHQSGVQFATDNEECKAGPRAICRFRVGTLVLFDKTSKLESADATAVKQAAWDLTCRIVRKRVLSAVTPKPEEPEKPKGIGLSTKFGRVVHDVHATDFEKEVQQKVADDKVESEQKARHKPGEACVSHGSVASATGATDTRYPHQWVLLECQNYSEPKDLNDPRGDAVWTYLIRSGTTAEEAARVLTEALTRSTYLASKFVEGRSYALWEYAAGRKPHWAVVAASYSEYRWTVEDGALYLTNAPARRFQVYAADGTTILPLTEEKISHTELVRRVQAHVTTYFKHKGSAWPGRVCAIDDRGMPWHVGNLYPDAARR